MNTVDNPKSGLKQRLPEPVKSIYHQASLLLYGLIDLQYWDRRTQRLPGLGWYLNPQAVSNRRRIQKFKNSHQGERCFIIGNGPSLSQMELSQLKNEITFGLNRIYLLFPKLGFSTTYYVSVNRLVVAQCSPDIHDLPMPRFISWHAREYLGFHPNFFYIRDPLDGTLSFATDPTRRIWEGATVTYVALQLAFFMGFQTVILIGVDHSFSTVGEPNKEITSTGEDPNHFDPNYFGAGFRWQLPDLETSEQAYWLAKNQFERHGREIIDATVNGKLTVFSKVPFHCLF
jgi:hypothetical protein